MFGKTSLFKIMMITFLLVSVVLLQPGCTKLMAILYFDNTVFNYAGKALDRLHFSYLKTANNSTFHTALTSQPWDLVIIDSIADYSLHDLDIPLLEELIDGGARMIITIHDMDEDASFWAKLGFVYEGPMDYLGDYRPAPVWTIHDALWEQLWDEPNNVASSIPMNQADDGLDVNHTIPNAFKGSVAPGGYMVGKYVSGTPDPDEGAVFMANDGRTIVNAFLLDYADFNNVPLDFDHDDIPDAIEWYMNEIVFVRDAGGVSVQPGQ